MRLAVQVSLILFGGWTWSTFPLTKSILKNSTCNGGAGLCIGQGVVMLRKVVTAGCGNGLELMVGQAGTKVMAGGGQRVKKPIIRIVHLIDPEHLSQTALVKTGIVGDKGQTFNHRRYLLPNRREYRRILRIFRPKTVDLPAEPLVVLRLRMNETVKRIHHFPAPDNDNPNAADTATLFVSGFKVYCSKIGHGLIL